MISGLELLIFIVVILSLIFTLTNGFHDAGSVVATLIYCGAASPEKAVLLASVFGLLGALFSGSMVADTVTKIVIMAPSRELMVVVAAAVFGAVVWNIATWKIGMPSSSTHALIGGLIGAAIAYNGVQTVQWGVTEMFAGHLAGVVKVVAALIFSPLLGFTLAFLIQKTTHLLLRNSKFKINDTIKKVQWFMAAGLAFSHGANDSQKVSGLIAISLFSAGVLKNSNVTTSIKLGVGAVMFLGTALGGWKIMKTLGRGIYVLRPIHSLNSMLSSGLSIILATFTGAPVSTTHVVVGGIAGVGAADEYRMVNWNVGREIVTAWLITIPCSALTAGIIFSLINGRLLQ